MMKPTVKDVMTTTVVAVKQGASYKEMAALLRKSAPRHIKLRPAGGVTRPDLTARA
jgi:hypothetical protein